MKREIANGLVYAGLVLMAATVAFILAGLFWSNGSTERLMFWINCMLFSLFSGIGVAIVGAAMKSVFSLEYVKSR